MRRTMYTTPVVRQVFRGFSWLGLKVTGWKLEGVPPKEPKYVLIAVPHTSNWDFPITLAMAFLFRFEISWMGKESLFRGMRGPLMRWMGGIPVHRKASKNTVQQTVDAFKRCDRMVLTLAPEGTRANVPKWKTGFYYIATGAGVPICLGYLDYKRKAGGFGPTFYPTGDIDRDLGEIRSFYTGISGRHVGQSQAHQ